MAVVEGRAWCAKSYGEGGCGSYFTSRDGRWYRDDTASNRPWGDMRPFSATRKAGPWTLESALRAVIIAFLWSNLASAADLCRDSAGKFTACPEVVVDPVPVPEPTPAPFVVAEKEPEPSPTMVVRAMAGGLTSISTDSDASVQPLASLQVVAPLSKSKKGPSIDVRLDLSALPDETVSLSDPQTFKALELGTSLVQPLGGPLLFSVYVEGGFASRLAVESEPVTRLPAWFSAGLVFATSDGDHELRLGMGPDQRLSGDWAASVHVSGRAKIGEKAGVGVYLVGSAIRALDLSGYGFRVPARDSLRVGVALGGA